MRNIFAHTMYSLILAAFFALGAMPIFVAFAQSTSAYGSADQVSWRIRFKEAAIVQGDFVTLGEVATPAGDIPANIWSEMAQRQLWPSPPEMGKAVNMTRPRLQEAVMETMKDLAPYSLFPGSMALQRGGAVVEKDKIQELVTRSLTPLTGNLGGETTFSDYRIPLYIFLHHPGQEIVVEPQKKFAPGRVNFRLLVQEVDGKSAQKISGSVFMDVWTNVPCSTLPLNKGDLLEPSYVGSVRVNLAHLRGDPWDGRGGPWRMNRPVGVQQIIYQSDLAFIPTVRKGNIVSVVYQSRTVQLTTQAEALSDGVTGENIPVRNLESKKEVYGTIRDGNTVVITGNL